jgi:hypothetical protein
MYCTRCTISQIQIVAIMTDATPSNHIRLWNLPEEVLFQVVSYAATATRRAGVLCHSIAPLCKGSYRTILHDSDRSARLWDIILEEDYSISLESCAPSPKRTKNSSQGLRRECPRLRRSPVQRVRDAHALMVDRTEICYYYLSEMTSTRGLSRPRMARIINEYGPHVRINEVVSSGGLFLVEICRARNVKEAVILRCVQELVEQRGASVNICTNEPPSSLNALSVAAVRGMATVVKYLLQAKADITIPGSGRFRLHTNPKKSLRCDNVTPLQFATSMIEAERAEGATERALRDLVACIRLLEVASLRE